MIKIGEFNDMLVYEKVEHGLYLVHPEENLDQEGFEKVLLPNAYVTPELRINNTVKVFIYLDSEDRIIATNLIPKLTVGQFASLPIVQVNSVGAFADIGLAKDLLIPFQQQLETMMEGRNYLVYMYLDDTTKRLIGTSKINQYLNNDWIKLMPGEEVDLIVINQTNLGFNVVVNGKHKGLVFLSDVFQDLNSGDQLKGFVKTIREDNKLDITLQQQGVSSIEPNAQRILDYLKQEGGKMDLTDKSDPELISHVFGMSKKSFKKALGTLYKKRLITLGTNNTSLI